MGLFSRCRWPLMCAEKQLCQIFAKGKARKTIAKGVNFFSEQVLLETLCQWWFFAKTIDHT